jgi:hypothetical protein
MLRVRLLRAGAVAVSLALGELKGVLVYRRLLILLVLPLGLAACSSMPSQQAPPQKTEPAAAATAPKAAEAQAAAPSSDGMLEDTRESVRSATEWLARGIDSWFGNKPFEEGGRVTNGRLGLRTTWREDEGINATLRFNARFDLPNLRDKAYVFIGRDDEREVVTDTPNAFSRQEQLQADQARQDQSFFAGLGLNLRDNIELRAGVRRGIRFYTQARYRKLFAITDRDELEFRETVFWTVSDGFGSTTAFSAEHVYSPSLALRWLNAATLSQKTDGVAWSSSLGLYKSFGELYQLSAEALINGETGRDINVSDYGVRSKWQQPIYRDWLIGEVIIGHFWPRKDAVSERERTWAFGLGVQMRF